MKEERKDYTNCKHCKHRIFEPFIVFGFRGHTAGCPVGRRLNNKFKKELAKSLEDK